MDVKLALSPNEDGMERKRLLWERFIICNYFMPPSCCGISPTSKFWLTSRLWRDCKLPISEGMLPWSIFLLRFRNKNFEHCPSCLGIKPLRLFAAKLQCSKEVWAMTSGTPDPQESFPPDDLKRGQGCLALLRCQFQVVYYQKSCCWRFLGLSSYDIAPTLMKAHHTNYYYSNQYNLSLGRCQNLLLYFLLDGFHQAEPKWDYCIF